MVTKEFDSALIQLHPNLERYAYSLTANHEDANDLLQETYLKALKNRDKFEDNTNLRAWAFVIMKNTYVNTYRKAKRRFITYNSGDNEVFLNAKSYNSPESEFSHNEISGKVNKLDDAFKIPFQMHTSGYKYKEIADKINLKIGTVKSRIFLTRQKLMSELSGY
jgi:RNA polymerase sigma-70 factor (ECF subfamily)